MNSCQYNLLISVICQCTYFIKHIFHGTAADSSTGIWNDTICAELITSILNFNISSCMISRLRQVKILVLFCLSDLFHLDLCFSVIFLVLCILFIFCYVTICIVCSFILFQCFDQILLLIISKHNVNAIIHLNLFFLRLDITSCSDNNCIRIHFSRPVQHLSRLAVRDICNSTCIDYIKVCPFLERNDLIPCFFKHFLHGFRLIGIYFASQIVQCCFLHLFLPLFSFYLVNFLTFEPASRRIYLGLEANFIV